MDYNCRDIPMKLDIKFQPLDFDIYLSQVIDVPITSLEQEPYNFQLEIEALKRVDYILERTQKEEQDRLTKLNESIIKPEPLNNIPSPNSSDLNININNNHQTLENNSNHIVNSLTPSPSCPTETPLTPMKTNITSGNSNDKLETSKEEEKSKMNKVNPRDFEDMHYNPFDHLELQTIDELRELDLVFQASYANPSGNQIQPTTTMSDSDSSTTPNIVSHLSKNLD